MKPSMLITQMKSISVATYGNQSPIAFDGRPMLRDLRLGDVVEHLAERLAAVGAGREPARMQRIPSRT